MRQVLITGATGKIGSRLVPFLISRGFQVRILVRRETLETKRFVDLGADLIMGDLLESHSVEQALDGTESIVHLAAFFRGATPEQSHSVNHTATVELARRALDRGVRRFVFASTALVYGPGKESPVRETETPNCITPYPLAKWAAEKALLDLHRDGGLDLRILRFAFVYGDGDPHLSESLPRLKEWAPCKRFQLVHHADIRQSLLLALQVDGISGEIFSVADDAPLTLRELRAFHGLAEGQDTPNNAEASPWDVVSDTRKIRVVLAYRPYYPTFFSAWAAGAL